MLGRRLEVTTVTANVVARSLSTFEFVCVQDDDTVPEQRCLLLV